MAQEVRTIHQQPPQTTGAPQSMPPRPVFLPPADIYETRDHIVVLAEMPGVAPDVVDITLGRRVLTIRGRSAANDHGGYQRVYNEYTDGDYERVFTLSENIDRDRIEAKLKRWRSASRSAQSGDREGAKDRAQTSVMTMDVEVGGPPPRPSLRFAVR
jgi:HSP20 family molecular chaperone IbpA